MYSLNVENNSIHTLFASLRALKINRPFSISMMSSFPTFDTKVRTDDTDLKEAGFNSILKEAGDLDDEEYKDEEEEEDISGCFGLLPLLYLTYSGFRAFLGTSSLPKSQSPPTLFVSFVNAADIYDCRNLVKYERFAA